MPASRVVRILPEVSGLNKTFDYTVPAPWAGTVAPGDIVRVDLHNRRVAGWVVDVDVEPPAGVELRSISKWSSVGPPQEIIDLARWAAHRWHGRLATLLKTASPERMVESVPDGRSGPQQLPDSVVDPVGELALEALAAPGVSVIRASPASDLFGLVAAVAKAGDAVVVTPDVGDARYYGSRLRRAGGVIRLAGRDWALGAGGGVVIGARSAVWAPVGELAAVVVLDEHAESLQEERNPTWHAREVAIERARRAGVPCLLVSPCPSVAALAAADRVLTLSRSAERAGWPPIQVVDRRREDPSRSGLFSPQLAAQISDTRVRGDRVVCIINRKGRARMLACSSCGELVKTEDGEHLMAEVDDHLVAWTGEERPKVCANCAGTSLKRLRLGVDRVREELAALAQEPVGEITAASEPTEIEQHRVMVGTEAALHRIPQAGLVVFLDFDQELMAQRYRAGEQAMALLVLAARMVGGKSGGGRVMVQTRVPDHRVLTSAVRADPGRFAESESELRRSLQYPPYTALAEVSGKGAGDAVAPLHDRLDVTVLGPTEDGRFLVRCADPGTLADALDDLAKTKARTRVAVDPPRV